MIDHPETQEHAQRATRRRAALPPLAAAAALLLGAWLVPSPASLAQPAARAAAMPVLRVCLYGGFAPFAIDDGGVWKGWDVDYLRGFAAANRLAFQVVKEKEFKNIWLRPGEDRCDVAGTSISDTADRRKATGSAGEWTATYYGVVRAFLVRTADREKLQRVADLAGKTVIVTADSTADNDLRNRVAQSHVGNVTIHGTDSEEAAADQVRKGAAFAYGGGYGSVVELAKRGGLVVVWPHCNMVTVTEHGSTRFEEYAEPFSFVVRKESGRLAALDAYIRNPKNVYEGTAIPDLGCKPPPWVPTKP